MVYEIEDLGMLWSKSSVSLFLRGDIELVEHLTIRERRHVDVPLVSQCCFSVGEGLELVCFQSLVMEVLIPELSPGGALLERPFS